MCAVASAPGGLLGSQRLSMADYVSGLAATRGRPRRQRGLMLSIRSTPLRRSTAGSAGRRSARRLGTAPDTYTPQHLAEKILSSKAALEGERTQVTARFAEAGGGFVPARISACRASASPECG